MYLSKFYLFAIGTAALAHMSENAIARVVCPEGKNITCSVCESTKKWSCKDETGDWITRTCVKNFPASPVSFKFDSAIGGAFPYCKYRVYYQPDQQGSWDVVELYNRDVTKDCAVTRSKNGFDCWVSRP